ncbi:MAG: phosphate butyryltransferase [Oscillospiraceae bacterium]|nr:phosphate butyryltransferase [Oscillospiraceae bacterium]
MLRTFEELRQRVGSAARRTVAVACAHDGHTLEAVLRAAEEGILDYILIGRKDDILRIGAELGHTIAPETVLDVATDEEAARLAVQLVREGKADFLQKGLMQTATLLKAVVNKETGIGQGRPMSHTALLEIPGYHKLLGVTDGGMIPNPDLEGKKAIARNAVDMFCQLGYERPLVSAVCAAENVSPKIIETVDAAALKEAARNGALGNCYLEGPISFDLAMNRASAEIKGYQSPVTGETDILLVPSMTAGNMLVKGLIEFAGARMVGVIIGAKCPIALNSRSASFEEKYNSLLTCALVSGGGR